MTPAVLAAPALVQNWHPVVDVLPASRQNQDSEVVQPWRRECRPSRGLLATCWSHSGNARTSHFAVADSTATHRQFWRSHSPQNSRHLRLSSGSSTNTPSQPNSIPRGRPSPWRLSRRADRDTSLIVDSPGSRRVSLPLRILRPTRFLSAPGPWST